MLLTPEQMQPAELAIETMHLNIYVFLRNKDKWDYDILMTNSGKWTHVYLAQY